MAVETPQKSPSMDPKLAAALSWFFAPIGSLIFMLLDDFKKRGAVFLTMSQAVGWFQKRRSARFATPTNDPGGISLKIPVSDQELGEGDEASPTLTLRVHSPTPNKELDQIRHSYYEDAEIP